MKAVFRNDIVEIQPISKKDCRVHLHTLDDSDRIKRSSAFLQLAASEVAKGYKVAEVSRNMQAMDRPKDRIQLAAAGGTWLNLKDIHNASSAWKKDNPDIRRQGCRLGWKEQRLQARDWLEKEAKHGGWYTADIQVSIHLFLSTSTSTNCFI